MQKVSREWRGKPRLPTLELCLAGVHSLVIALMLASSIVRYGLAMLVSASNVNVGYRDCSHAKLLLLVHEKAACTLQVDAAGQHRGTVQHLQRSRDLVRSIAPAV